LYLQDADYVEIYEEPQAKPETAIEICDKKLDATEKAFASYKKEVSIAHDKLRAYVKSHTN